ncbi:MAG: hypothetical protein HDS99_03270 [Bacteroidales bacterium]|nr:hypothetical protein [Oscillospiraceae bacterium]MBD5182797.1 hypothetical protein [Bacteroidales bacterium]
MSYNDDKRELLKLKQGLITESEIIKEEAAVADKAHYEVKGVRKKIANFFYHYKWHLIIILFFAVIIFFLTYSIVSKEKADIRTLIFAESEEVSGSLYYKSHDLELALEQYTHDFDENGNVHVEVYYIDMNPRQDGTYHSINQTKLMSEVGMATAQLYIADRAQLETILGDQDESKGFEDLSALYPDDPQVTDKYYYKVKGSAFAEAAMYLESCPDDLYIAVRSNEFSGYAKLDEGTKENHRRALETLDNIVRDNKVNSADSEEDK